MCGQEAVTTRLPPSLFMLLSRMYQQGVETHDFISACPSDCADVCIRGAAAVSRGHSFPVSTHGCTDHSGAPPLMPPLSNNASPVRVTGTSWLSGDTGVSCVSSTPWAA